MEIEIDKDKIKKTGILFVLLFVTFIIGFYIFKSPSITGSSIVDNKIDATNFSIVNNTIQQDDQEFDLEIPEPKIKVETEPIPFYFSENTTISPYYSIYYNLYDSYGYLSGEPIMINYGIKSERGVYVYFVKSEHDWDKSVRLDRARESFKYFCKGRGSNLKGNCNITSGGLVITNSQGEFIDISIDLEIY